MKTNQSIWVRCFLGFVAVIGAFLGALNAVAVEAPVWVSASVLQQDARVGEPIPVKIEIKNTGDQPIDPQISYPRLFGRFKASALQTIEEPSGPSSIRRAQQLIMPGESRSWTVVLNRYLRLDTPGTYAATYSGEIFLWRDSSTGLGGRIVQVSSDKFEVALVSGPARSEVLQRIARQVASTDQTEAALGYDMLLHAEIDGALELLIKYAGDTRFKHFRSDTIGRLAKFLPDVRAVNTIVSIPPINDSRLMLAAIQAFEKAGQRFPEERLKSWYAQSNEMTKESTLAYFTDLKLSEYARIVREP